MVSTRKGQAKKTLVYKKARENINRNHTHKKTKEKPLCIKQHANFFFNLRVFIKE